MVPHEAQKSEICIKTLIERKTHDMWPGFSLFFCHLFGLKPMEQTELGIAISVQKEEKYIIFTISYVLVLALWLLFMEKDRGGKCIILTSHDK